MFSPWLLSVSYTTRPQDMLTCSHSPFGIRISRNLPSRLECFFFFCFLFKWEPTNQNQRFNKKAFFSDQAYIPITSVHVNITIAWHLMSILFILQIYKKENKIPAREHLLTYSKMLYDALEWCAWVLWWLRNAGIFINILCRYEFLLTFVFANLQWTSLIQMDSAKHEFG